MDFIITKRATDHQAYSLLLCLPSQQIALSILVVGMPDESLAILVLALADKGSKIRTCSVVINSLHATHGGTQLDRNLYLFRVGYGGLLSCGGNASRRIHLSWYSSSSTSSISRRRVRSRSCTLGLESRCRRSLIAWTCLCSNSARLMKHLPIFARRLRGNDKGLTILDREIRGEMNAIRDS